jgi:protein phosphatase
MGKGAVAMYACALTDVGKARHLNQDSVFCSESGVGNLPNLFIVADGMGGHRAGDYASRTAVEFLLQQIREKESRDPIVILKDSVEKMNGYLWRCSRENPSLAGMGTTLVAAVLTNDTLQVVNVGDSRLYVIGDEIHQVTRDHSLVEELIAQGRLVRGSAEYHAKKNVITRAVGVDERVAADFFEVKLLSDEKILLCSDGLTNMITDDEIYTIVHRSIPLRERAAALVEAANLSGGRDNITVVLIER